MDLHRNPPEYCLTQTPSDLLHVSWLSEVVCWHTSTLLHSYFLSFLSALLARSASLRLFSPGALGTPEPAKKRPDSRQCLFHQGNYCPSLDKLSPSSSLCTLRLLYMHRTSGRSIGILAYEKPPNSHSLYVAALPRSLLWHLTVPGNPALSSVWPPQVFVQLSHNSQSAQSTHLKHTIPFADIFVLKTIPEAVGSFAFVLDLKGLLTKETFICHTQ